MREDRDLIAAYLAGDECGFEEFYGRHRRQVYVYLLSFAGNRATAEELLQETFCVFLRQLPRLRDRTDLRACLITIARSRAIDRLRRERLEDRALQARTEDPLLRPAQQGFSSDSAPHDAEKLSRLLRSLPEAQREAVVLRVQVGLTFAEIGRLSGVPENTAVSRYRYGIRKLRASLVAGGCDEGNG